MEFYSQLKIILSFLFHLFTQKYVILYNSYCNEEGDSAFIRITFRKGFYYLFDTIFLPSFR